MYGWLRSYDQFANLVLQDTIERIFIDDKYGDIEKGVYLVRGENVVLLGEVDDEAIPCSLQQIPGLEALELYKQKLVLKQEKNAKDKIILESLGFCVETIQGDYY